MSNIQDASDEIARTIERPAPSEKATLMQRLDQMVERLEELNLSDVGHLDTADRRTFGQIARACKRPKWVPVRGQRYMVQKALERAFRMQDQLMHPGRTEDHDEDDDGEPEAGLARAEVAS